MSQNFTLKYLLFIISWCWISITNAQNIALNFDGVNDYVQTTYPGITGNAPRTVEAWVRTTATGSAQKVIVDWGDMSTGARFTISMLQNNSLRIELGGNGIPGTIAINDGVWHHIAVVYNPSATLQYTTYVDGVQNSQGNITVPTVTSSINNLMIGRRNDATNYWQGDIDEVRVYNYAKTQAQVQASMSTEFCPLPTGLVAYFKLNDGVVGASNAGNNIAYNAVTSQNGTLNGFSLSGTTSNWVTGPVLTSNNSYSSITAFNCSAYTGPSGNHTWTQSGTYTDTLPNAVGCDSVISVNLTIGATSSYIIAFSCGTYTAPSGNVITTFGTHFDTLYNGNALGCDSIIQLVLVSGRNYATVNTSACDTVITASGKVVTQSGTVVDTLMNSNQYGCDSIITYHITILGNGPQTISIEACESFISDGGVTYTTTGTYQEIYPSAIGCDSIINYEIIINNAVITNQTIVACDSALINGTWYTNTQLLQFNEISSKGCDSTVYIDLTIGTVDASISQNVYQLTANQNGGTYQWFDCATNQPLAGETNQSFTATTNGQYAVEVSVGDCTEMSDCVTITGISVEEFFNSSSIKIFPNPNTGKFTVQTEKSYEIETIELIDVVGNVVYSSTMNATNVSEIEVEAAKGIYFLRLKSHQAYFTQKIVIE